jgi:hypothetical protein
MVAGMEYAGHVSPEMNGAGTVDPALGTDNDAVIGAL